MEPATPELADITRCKGQTLCTSPIRMASFTNYDSDLLLSPTLELKFNRTDKRIALKKESSMRKKKEASKAAIVPAVQPTTLTKTQSIPNKAQTHTRAATVSQLTTTQTTKRVLRERTSDLNTKKQPVRISANVRKTTAEGRQHTRSASTGHSKLPVLRRPQFKSDNM